jgi:excisionase family DNA binding protein
MGQEQSVVVSPYLTAGEAAAYIRSTIHAIYALVKRGRLKPMPGCRRLLFTREALDECLKKRRR